MAMNKRIEKAEKVYKKAAVDLSRTLQSEYPLGTNVTVKFGGRIFDAEITGYGSWWCEPTYLRGVNLQTGKTRRFPVSAICGGGDAQGGESDA